MATNQYLEYVIKQARVVFTREDITKETRFKEDLNAKSLNVAQLMNTLEDEYDVEIPFMEFKRKETIADVAAYIEELAED